jgi:type I restriction enzyme S subunit
MSWEKISLGRICTMLSGNAWSASKFKDAGTIPLIRIQNLGNNENEKFIYWNDPFDEKFIVKKGDILLSLSGSIKVDVWDGVDALLNQRIVKLTPNYDVDHKWFFWQITSIILDIERMGKWALVNNVSITDLKEIQIPLPPLATQKRIAEILDAADALRRKDQELLKKYDELAQAIFIDMFGDPVKNEKGWEVKTLADIQVKKSQNGLYVSKEKYSSSEGVEMVHMSDAFYGIVKQGDLKRVIIPESEAIKYKLSDNDILVARRSLNYEGAVKPCLIRTNGNFLIYESSLIRIVIDQNKIHPLYLFYFLSNEKAKKEYVLKYVTKSTISGINNENLNKIQIVVPSIKLQLIFNDRIQEINKLIEINKINLSDILFNSLIQKAFSGELVA